MLRAGRAALCIGTLFWAGAISGSAYAAMGELTPRSARSATNAQQEWVVDPRTGCRALDADFDVGDSVQWQGVCVEGMISGQGTLSFLNGGQILETITGTFGEGALLPGHVSATWSDGSRYDGEQSDGQFEGMGNFVSATRDQLNGEWKAGALNGKATVIWANGDRYDGNWKDGKSDGEGTEVWANGDRFAGLWRDGAPVRQTATAQNGSQAFAAPAAAVQPENRMPTASGPPAASEVTPAVATPQDAAGPGVPAAMPLHDFEGKRLIAVDGSTIDLGPGGGGLMRVVTLPNGVTQQTSFAFMNNRIGTVSNETAAIGLFRANGDEIDTNYIDGTTEVMKPVSADGLLLTSHDPDGSSACTAWYPEGHAFSQDEKRAAVEEYATRLGISNSSPSSSPTSSPSKKHHAPAHTGTPTCGGGFVRSIAATGSAPSLTPSAKPSSGPANGIAPDSSTNGLQTIPVRDSTVHLIDAPYEQAATPKAGQDASIQPPAGASKCLSVTTNGEYWGFQNRCETAVQFAYCEMSDVNPLTSCHNASVYGSVAANGFSALVNDRSLSAEGIEHEFRWMECNGGAGEVVPHLDSIDPPSGRCLRVAPADNGTRPGPAGS